ncbi:AAA family ATPase [Kutzneria kofuensis]|uniref:DNA-binding CsgD family transcriptional regulator n=1 Tax=Kutzneria kofuensis TaxID=103725 RepID=A0A7W9NK69_9PSEU|nr:LuxR family transcriptional regulator [Kutzneria kofuensis]MBB5895071.1 DNA-binding CsgD family transcriptional regulator [Kutzneria kofuensis]
MLCERETEFGLVAEALQAAADGHGSLMVITGPLGIGKTALLGGLPSLAGLQGARVMRANGALLEQDFAFGLVRQLLEPVLASVDQRQRDEWLAGAAEPARLVFDDLAGPDETQEWEHLRWDDGRPDGGVRHTVLHGLLMLLTAISLQRPVLVVVDDLQWADQPSLRWLGYLAKRLGGVRATVVVTVREGDPLSERPLVRAVTDGARRTLRPGPLSLASTRLMVAEEFGEPGEEEFVQACHEVSDGNPMFLMSVLLGMAVSGYRPIAADAPIARSLLPSQLRERLTSCLSSQPAGIQSFVKAMAVLGEQADAELLGQLSELDPIGCVEAARVLDRMGLLACTTPVPKFLHMAVQDAVEQLMSADDAERLHRRAAALLHAGGYPAEQVAAHLLVISADQDDWTILVLRAAADTALSRGAPEVATRYLRRALLDCSSDGSDRAMLLVELATAECWFDPAAAVRHISQAVPLLSSTRERALAVSRIAPPLLGVASSPVLDVIAQVAAELGDPDKLAGTDRELALSLEARLRCTQADNPARLAMAVERLRELGDHPSLDTRGERELAAVLVHAGTLSGGLPAAQAVPLARRIVEHEPAVASHAHAAVPLVVTTLVAGDCDDVAGPWLDLALRQARRQNAVVPQAIITTHQSMILMRARMLSQARGAAAEGLALADADWLRTVSAPTKALAMVAIETDSVDLAERLLAKCTEHGEALPSLWPLHMVRAWLAARDGRLGQALNHLYDLGRRTERIGWRNPAIVPWRSWAAGLHHQLGEQADAVELVRTEHEMAREWGSATAMGRALRVWGTITEGPKGTQLLRDAITTLDNSAHQLELARAQAALGARLGGAEGDVYLRQAGAVESTPWLPVRSTAPTRTTATRTQLTKTERKVAMLAAAGRTNGEIADELGVSSRAVEKHLTNSYRKLAVPGRAGLVAAMLAQAD